MTPGRFSRLITVVEEETKVEVEDVVVLCGSEVLRRMRAKTTALAVAGA